MEPNGLCPLAVSEGWGQRGGVAAAFLPCATLEAGGSLCVALELMLGENLSVETGGLQNHSKEVGIGLP